MSLIKESRSDLTYLICCHHMHACQTYTQWVCVHQVNISMRPIIGYIIMKLLNSSSNRLANICCLYPFSVYISLCTIFYKYRNQWCLQYMEFYFFINWKFDLHIWIRDPFGWRFYLWWELKNWQLKRTSICSNVRWCIWLMHKFVCL